MTGAQVTRSFRGIAQESAITSIHDVLDGLWSDVPEISDIDQMTFTTAIIESAANVVQHAQPQDTKSVEIGVDILVQPDVLTARISAFHATAPPTDLTAGTPDDDEESGRGLALIEALVSAMTFERQQGTSTWVLTRHRGQ